MTPLSEIRQAFNAALEMSSTEREALLAELPEAVRAEVVSLLSAHETAGRFLGDSEEIATRDGERIGPYLLMERIGEGGMGVVYRARRDDGEFQREVAIKLVSGHLFPPEAQRRFIAERQILARLDHSNIVQMIDGGVAHGQRYLVMELISGEPVTEHCSKRSLPIPQRLRLFQSICSAIQYAHQRLIIHRDLKPHNILVTREGQVKILDFGIARLLASDATGDPGTTALHPMTLSCASPEQVREGPLTLASDIYSLGLLLYELLTGKNPQSTGTRAEIMQLILIADPAPPSRLVPGISPDLDAIVLKALAKEPARRYASAEEMSADIGRFLEGRPVLARPPSRLYHAARFCACNKVPTAIAVALLVAVIAGALSTLSQARRAENRFNELRSLAHSYLFEVYDSITALPGSVTARRLLVSRAQQYLDSLAREAAGDSSLHRELAESYLRLGDVQGRPYLPNLGDTTGALENYKKAQMLLEQESARRPKDAAIQDELTQAYMNVSVILMRQRNAEGAGAAARKAIAMSETLMTRYSANAAYIEKVSHAYMRLGQAQFVAAQQSGSLSEFQQVLASYRRSLAVLEAAGRNDPSWQSRISAMHFYIGYPLRELGDRTGEVSYYQQALDSSRKGDAINRQLAAANPNQANLRNLADGLTDIGQLRWKCCRDLAGALRDEYEALAGFQKNSDRDPRNLEARRDVANAFRDLGLVLGEAGRRPEALGADRKALAIYQELDRSDPSSQENNRYIVDVQVRIAELQGNAVNGNQSK